MRMIYTGISLFMLFIMMNNKEKVKDECIYMYYFKKKPNAKISKPFDILWFDGLNILFLLPVYVFVHRRWL